MRLRHRGEVEGRLSANETLEVRKSLGLPQYLLPEQMPQRGHTETVDASEIDLRTIWAKVEELSKVKR